MRITIVLGPFLPVPPVLGGAVEKVHLQLAGAYRAAGHEVTIVSRRYPQFADDEVVEGVRHLRIPSFDRRPSLWQNLALDLVYARRVARTLPLSDITVTNSFSVPLLLPRRRAGRIYMHVARFPKGQMRLYARADRLQALSQAVAKAIIKQAPALAPKVVAIGYPVPDRYFIDNEVTARGRTVLYVGRIAREKGVHLLIKAFALLCAGASRGATSWKLRIIGPHKTGQGGDGEAYYNELRSLARPLGTACEFTGPVFDEPALIRAYREASIFAYPSLAESGEAFGLSALEAMASGCAVIVSNLLCFDDFVRDGENALKFDHRSGDAVAALAAKLSELIDSPGRLQTLSRSARETANHYRVGAIADRMLQDFRVVVGH